jgi:hypothetical protein
MVRDSKFGNGIFVTPGEIGTHAMHPPGTRIIDIDKRENRIDTRGRTRRSAPTRRICPMVRDSKFGNGIFVTSGDLGTHAIHPPRKRESNNADRKQSIFETRGRTRRSAPTRRFVRQCATTRFETGFLNRPASAALTSINGKIVPNAQEGVAARPYTEILHPPRRQSS